MWAWIVFFILSVTFAQHLSNLLTPMFNAKNITYNPVTGRKQYSVRDEFGMCNNYSLVKGVLLSVCQVLYGTCCFAILFAMWFLAEHWWHALIAFVCSLVFRIIWINAFPLKMDSDLFYIELMASPVCIFLTMYFMIWY